MPFQKNHKINIGSTPWNKDKKIDKNTYPNFGHNKKHSEETKKIIKEKRKLQIFTEETRKKMSLASLGKKKSKKHAENISKSKKGVSKSVEAKIKMRESAFNYTKKTKGIMFPRIGRNEKDILDKKEVELGYRIIRQYKCGGYYLDGYIPELNWAIEVDEYYHKNRKEKDTAREEFIKQKLGCEFIRINDYV